MENKTITTAGGHSVVLKSFITGRDKRHIQDAFMEDVELHQAGEGKPSFTLQASKANIATDRAISAVVVSVNGATENVLDAVLNLPMADYDEVLEAVNVVTGDKKKEEVTPKI